MFTAFVNDHALETYAPKEPKSRAAFVKLCANLLRMDCLLLERDLKLGRVVPVRPAARQQLGSIWKFVGAALSKEDNAKTEVIVKRVLASLS